MQIRGVWGDQSAQLAPEQWVNVWENTITGLEFYCTCQVAELGELATEDYALEPVEDSGYRSGSQETSSCDPQSAKA